jgi:hypothetical protein
MKKRWGGIKAHWIEGRKIGKEVPIIELTKEKLLGLLWITEHHKLDVDK